MDTFQIGEFIGARFFEIVILFAGICIGGNIFKKITTKKQNTEVKKK